MLSRTFLLFFSLACTGESDTLSDNNIPDKEEHTAEEPQPNEINNTPEKTLEKTPGVTQKVSKEALPDLTKGLSKKGCDNGPGVHGAVSYFVGELKIDNSGSVSGSESWLFYANTKWKEKEGKDCEVKWGLRGDKGGTNACGTCDFGVSLINAMDVTSSTCPKDLAKNETGQQIQYDIKLHNDGRADIYFSKSGKKVGEGYHKDGTIRYVTPSSCRWF
jgi:hypothetical protein